jgi:hypothetical protein
VGHGRRARVVEAVDECLGDPRGPFVVRCGIGADDHGDLRQRTLGRAGERVEGGAFNQERMPVTQPGVAVAAGPVRLGDRDVAGIVGVGRAVFDHRDLDVPPAVAPQQTGIHGYGGQRWIPGRAVVQAGLPRVHDAGQPATAHVALLRKVALLGDEARVEPTQLGPGGLRVGGAGPPVDVPGRERVHRRLDDSGGLKTIRARRDLPERRPGEVVPIRDTGVEDDVRHPPVRPLCLEEAAQVTPGPFGRVVGQPDADEPGVPTPLMRVERASGHGMVARPVGIQHLGRGLPQLLAVVVHPPDLRIPGPVTIGRHAGVPHFGKPVAGAPVVLDRLVHYGER